MASLNKCLCGVVSGLSQERLFSCWVHLEESSDIVDRTEENDPARSRIVMLGDLFSGDLWQLTHNMQYQNQAFCDLAASINDCMPLLTLFYI